MGCEVLEMRILEYQALVCTGRTSAVCARTLLSWHVMVSRLRRGLMHDLQDEAVPHTWFDLCQGKCTYIHANSLPMLTCIESV